DQVPILTAQRGHRFAQEEAGEKIFKPPLALVFETVDGFEHDAAGDDRRARGTEMQLQLTAIRAFKGRRKVACVGQAAAPAKRRLDEAHLRPAVRAHVAVPGGGAFGFAQPADFGVEKTETGVDPPLDGLDEGSHRAMANGSRPGLRGRRLKTASVTASTRKASQPSINLPVPQKPGPACGMAVVNAP